MSSSKGLRVIGDHMKHKLVTVTMLIMGVFAVPVRPALASTWYVNGVSGSDSHDCKSSTTACKTIGHAISLASSGDSIMVARATYTENLLISKSLNVMGSGAGTTIIDGGGVNCPAENSITSCRVVTISPATTATVVLSGLTIRNGSAHYSSVGSSGDGGGISNSNGTLTISNSTVSGNVANGGRCIIFLRARCYGGSGGGISSSGTLTINNSAISGNVAMIPCRSIMALCYAGGGGGISFSGTLNINNSTISGNTASGSPFLLSLPSGGGISSNGTLMISNSTISGNSADDGGGIASGDTMKIQNSIVANNLPSNCYGLVTSEGYNLSSDGSCNFNLAGDLNNHDPLLGPLQNNGGPTQTMALQTGSLAIDGGNPGGCTDGQGHLLKTDQRGMPRPNREDISGCDIGAYERQSD